VALLLFGYAYMHYLEGCKMYMIIDLGWYAVVLSCLVLIGYIVSTLGNR
jgi:hypothetical protein